MARETNFEKEYGKSGRKQHHGENMTRVNFDQGHAQKDSESLRMATSIVQDNYMEKTMKAWHHNQRETEKIVTLRALDRSLGLS